MMTMKLFLPGRFEDAYVYMGRLVALTENKTLRIYDLAEIVQFIEAHEPSLVPVPTLMFTHNEWLGEAPFQKLMESEGIAREVLWAFQKFPQPYFECSETKFRVHERELGIQADVLLDINIYNRRLYIGSNTGLYHIDLDWDTPSDLLSSQVVRKLDARCLETSAKFGAVNASCGEEGLFTAIDDFGWNKARGSILDTRHGLDMAKVSGRSIRTAWTGYDLVNYVDAISPVLLRTSRRRADSNLERERSVITEIGTERVDLRYILDVLSQRFDIEEDTFQYAYNDANSFYIHTVEGRVYEVKISAAGHEQPKLNIRKAYSYIGADTRVLSANPTRVGQIVETFDRVLVLSDGEPYSLVDSDVISVRTFPQSARYQNLVAITTENGVLLAGLFNDTALTRAGGKILNRPGLHV